MTQHTVHTAASNATAGASVAKAFAKVTGLTGVASLAHLREESTATCFEAIGVLGAHKAIEPATTVQPVALGKYSVPPRPS